jgi:gliding motility-associated lipoprotein GldH
MRHRIRLRNNLSTILLTVAVALTLVGCNRATVYHQYEHVSSEGWDRTDTLRFHIAPAKAAAILHEEVELRTNGHYPFTDLCLIVEQTIYPSHTDMSPYSSQNTRRIDTLTCSIADKNGIAKGKGLNYIQNHYHLTDLNVSEGDSIDVAIYHHMRKEVLSGIVDLGIKLQKQ